MMKMRPPFAHMALNKDLVGGVGWCWMGKPMNTVHRHLLSKLFIFSLMVRLNSFCWEQGIGPAFTEFWEESLLDASLYPDFASK